MAVRDWLRWHVAALSQRTVDDRGGRRTRGGGSLAGGCHKWALALEIKDGSGHEGPRERTTPHTARRYSFTRRGPNTRVHGSTNRRLKLPSSSSTAASSIGSQISSGRSSTRLARAQYSAE